MVRSFSSAGTMINSHWGAIEQCHCEAKEPSHSRSLFADRARGSQIVFVKRNWWTGEILPTANCRLLFSCHCHTTPHHLHLGREPLAPIFISTDTSNEHESRSMHHNLTQSPSQVNNFSCQMGAKQLFLALKGVFSSTSTNHLGIRAEKQICPDLGLIAWASISEEIQALLTSPMLRSSLVAVEAAIEARFFDALCSKATIPSMEVERISRPRCVIQLLASHFKFRYQPPHR